MRPFCQKKNKRKFNYDYWFFFGLYRTRDDPELPLLRRVFDASDLLVFVLVALRIRVYKRLNSKKSLIIFLFLN